MYLLSHRDSLVSDSHVNVTGLFRDTITPTFSACSEALQDRTLFDVDNFDEQLVNVSAIIMLGVRNCGLQHFLDDGRALFRAELQNVECCVNFLAADLISHQATLLIRQAHTFEDSFGFHYFFAFLSAAWPLNVRVSANSPSL